MKIVHVVGARPNFMKVAPVFRALGGVSGMQQFLLHTGQHYDDNMNRFIFEDLGLPQPDVNLNVGSGSHAQQTAQVMIRCEEQFLEVKPDWVLVYGDVNSTVAAALVAAKLGIRVAHVEAGLRSRDRTMPEEINRLLTDQLSDLLFIPSEDGRENLLNEGIAGEKIVNVGNVMIDTLIQLLPKAEALDLGGTLPFSVPDRFGLVTLHRPSNVDEPETFYPILESLNRISEQIPLIFPVHPRTRRMLGEDSPVQAGPNIHVVDPISYLPFLALQSRSALIITDSGGIQEETTYLHKPCLTLRENTERPITISLGTNRLIGKDLALLESSVTEIMEGRWPEGEIPELWDGHAGERIAEILAGLAEER